MVRIRSDEIIRNVNLLLYPVIALDSSGFILSWSHIITARDSLLFLGSALLVWVHMLITGLTLPPFCLGRSFGRKTNRFSNKRHGLIHISLFGFISDLTFMVRSWYFGRMSTWTSSYIWAEIRFNSESLSWRNRVKV